MGSDRIVVIGAGPAGAAAAIGLARMGEPVTLVGEPRRFAAVEGVSVRVMEALRGLGLKQALQAFAPQSPRRALWSGVHTEANTEYLVDRQLFDQNLLDDLECMGVTVLRGHVLGLESQPGRHVIQVDVGGRLHTLDSSFIIEARGRAAPGGGLPRVRGAETVSLLQYWQGPSGEVHSAVQSCEDGWVWMAAPGDGRRYLQLTLDVRSAALPSKRALADYCSRRFRAVTTAAPFLRDAVPMGEPYARTSTPVLNEVVAGDDWIRVGDAAMAVDPLSGNGIFQALSSALQAPAVVATLRHDPARAALARQFHQQRIEHLFYRFARIGRDFYAQEAAWAKAPFWAARRNWPDSLPLHAVTTPAVVSTACRPVVSQGRIIEKEVVITPDQPLGVWHLDGIPLAPLLRTVQVAESDRTAEGVLQGQHGLDAALAFRIAGWMRVQGWII